MSKQISNLTYQLEKYRAVTSGVLDTANMTFLLLIAVQVFNSGPTTKALVGSGISVGFLLSPFITQITGHFRIRVSNAASLFLALAGVFFLLSVVIPNPFAFAVGAVLGPALSTACVPLVTQILSDNYGKNERGKLYAKTNVIRLISGIVFGLVVGYLLSDRLADFYRALTALFALACFAGAICLYKVPSEFLSKQHSSPLSGLRAIRSDRVFRLLLISWMIMGFANHMMFPLRIEYLANPKYGLHLTAFYVALFVTVIPSCIRIFLNPFWGKLFDKTDFFYMRIAINVGFLFAIATFFMSDSMWGLAIGAIIFGASNAGGEVAWSLWVTKFAEKDAVVKYMTIHTFLTGVRGVIAPIVSFHLAQSMSITAIAMIALGLNFLASLMLIPEARVKDRKWALWEQNRGV